MASDKQYRTIHGVVEFPPKEGQAGGKDVRNICVSQTGFKEQAVKVYATLWPSHAHCEVEEGDVVTLRGSFTVNRKDDKVFNNLSVSGFYKHGALDTGVKPDTTNESAAEDIPDDDIPF